jgi:ABC-type polysaccharide/polyol phosphate export permease
MLGGRTWVADLNPFYHLLCVVRQPLLGMAPTAANWSGALSALALGAILYFILFPAYRRRIPFWV